MAIATVYGIGGIGKSALAIQVAHQLADAFPDGQLYADLHGATAGVAPLEPLEVLGRFLRALGLDGRQVPGQVDEAAARLRSLTAGRRLLLVLDNVHDTSQVAPLLPGGPGCGVLITSRRVLAGLDGASGLQLKVLAPQEAVALLGRLIGEERIAVDPAAADELARRCGCWPSGWPMPGAGWTSWSCRTSGCGPASGSPGPSCPTAPTMRTGTRPQPLRCSGSWTAPRLACRWRAAADRPEPETDRVLERLVDAQLLETSSPGRYRVHDLLRVYAREQATRECTPQQQAAALRRVLGRYVATCWRTLDLLCPGDPRLGRADGRWREGGLEFADEPAALGWLEAERANLLAALEQAAANNDLGLVHQRQGHHDQTLACHQQSLAIRRELGDPYGEAESLRDLGVALQALGHHQEKLARWREALAIFEQLRCADAETIRSLLTGSN